MKTTMAWMILAVIALALFVLFSVWSIQMAWLTSFPDSDRQASSRTFEINVAVAIVSLIFSGLFAWRAIRTGRADGPYKRLK